jgi:PilZ domain
LITINVQSTATLVQELNLSGSRLNSSLTEANPMEQQFAVERVENRVEMKITAMLIGTHGKLGVEKATTENVSARGVRVISADEWYSDDVILVSIPAGHFTSAARVAYCDALGQGRFGIGLEFVGSSEQLDTSSLQPSVS